jgi:hypothetical protein
MKTKLVGLSFKKFVPDTDFQEGVSLTITHEPSNKFDTQALLVDYKGTELGYIGKGCDIYDIARDNFPMEAKVVDFYIRNDINDSFTQFQIGELVSVNLEVADVVALDSENDIASFNEEGVIINFDETPHTYTYEGRILKGATTFIKKYIEDFQSDVIAGRCANHWNLPKKYIQDAWSLAGDLSASFGTGIHKAMEFEDLYRFHTKKDGERCFTIKHPVIKRIVEEFFVMYNNIGFEGEVFPEALISSVRHDQCALADRILVIDREEKICRIQDYKVNHSVEKKGSIELKNLPKGFEKLPTTKLTKMSLQLKVIEQMLSLSGWTVLGFDIFVYCDGWEYYEIDPLEGFTMLE